MTRGKFLALALPMALMAAGSARAADERLLERAYAENQVVRVEGKLGVQATIAFGDKEAIENVAVGNSQSWQITPNKRGNLLFVKPIEAGARTNMTVVTDKHTYFFDLVVSPKAQPLYMLRFTYKDEPVEVAAPSLAAGVAPARDDPAMLNFAWRKKGKDAIMPSRVYDDGEATYLLWPADKTVPAILMRNAKGEEGPVNYSVRGAAIVVDGVPGQILLRQGRSSAVLTNLRPAPAAPVSATASPAVLPAEVPVAAPARATAAGASVAAQIPAPASVGPAATATRGN